MAYMKCEYKKGWEIIGVDLYVHDIHDCTVFSFIWRNVGLGHWVP